MLNTHAVTKFLDPHTYINYLVYRRNIQAQRSHAQLGEDVIMDFACWKELYIPHPTYLDVGTHDPIHSNNTYFFYRKGDRGVCVEPNPELFKRIQRERSGDVCLNVGIGPTHDSAANYYVMTSNAHNTFSKEEAESIASNTSLNTPQRIERVLQVPIVTINSVIEKYLPNGVDILSLDTEGFNLDILRSLDFAAHAPRIICVETLSYTTDGTLQKNTDTNDYLFTKGYVLYADTRVNSIFIKK